MIDGNCGSSCHDILDYLVKLPHVRLVGQSTDGTTVYSELNRTTLPSDIGFNFPMKIIEKRVRKSNQPYSPKQYYHGDIKNTAKLKQWVYSDHTLTSTS